MAGFFTRELVFSRVDGVIHFTVNSTNRLIVMNAVCTLTNLFEKDIPNNFSVQMIPLYSSGSSYSYS